VALGAGAVAASLREARVTHGATATAFLKLSLIVVETNRLQLRGNCPDKNLALNSQDYAIVVV
jgi:hypothetical protein